MDIEVFVHSKGSLGTITEAQKDIIVQASHCVCIDFNRVIQTVGDRIDGILSSEEKLVLSRVESALKLSNIIDSTIIVKDIRKIKSRFELWFKHRKKSTPLVIMGDQFFEGTPSIEQLKRAINNSIN
ncbi:MAG: hypothetical protein ACXACK_09225 [Candidatus Hodarchaeales archaeon]